MFWGKFIRKICHGAIIIYFCLIEKLEITVADAVADLGALLDPGVAPGVERGGFDH